MGLETATYLAQLDKTWPLSADLTSQGDDHLRLIKKVLQQQFPGASGSGFSKQIIANEDEINRLDGVTSNIQAQFNAIEGIPQGTSMIFYQPSAPTGWTKSTSKNDYMLRVVSGSGGGSGGSISPISHTHTTGSHSLTENEMPSHRHNIIELGGQGQDGTSGWNRPLIGAPLGNKWGGYTGGGASHSHGSTGSVSIKYIDTIICQKD